MSAPDEQQWRRATTASEAEVCVEVARCACGKGVALRDSRHPDEPPLLFTREAWAEFLDKARSGEFDRFA